MKPLAQPTEPADQLRGHDGRERQAPASRLAGRDAAGPSRGALPRDHRSGEAAVAHQPDQAVDQILDPMLDRAVAGMRWLALAVVLVVGLLDPTPGRLGLTTAHLAVAVALYSLLLQAALRRLPGAISYGSLAVLDAAVVSVADLVAGRGASPVFLLYFPALIGAALTLRPIDGSFLTFAVGLLSTSIAVTQPDWAWQPEQLQLLGVRLVALLLLGLVTTTLTRQLGIQRWSAERERSAAARLTLLNDLLRGASSRLDVGQILAGVAATTRRGLQSDVAVAILFEPGDGRPRGWASGDLPADALCAGAVELARGVARGGRRLRAADACALPEARALCRLGLRSLLVVPLEADAEVLGALLVGRRVSDAYGAECLDWLLTIAQHAALPIRNARLRELERANAARLAELERAKSSFLSGVSHDLRTPLTSVKVAAGLLAERRGGGGEADDTERSLLASLRRNTERLERLVDEILDMVRLQGGALSLRLEQLDLRSLVREVALGVKPMLDVRGQRLALSLPDEPALVWGDRRRLEQVLVNLLANANKHGPTGSTIHVSVSPAADRRADPRGVDAPPGGGELVVCVADEGPGIPPAERERVFQPFYRVGAAERSDAGAGLGLAIARSLVELHGGRIWVDGAWRPEPAPADGDGAPRPGPGARLAFAIPVRQDAAPGEL